MRKFNITAVLLLFLASCAHKEGGIPYTIDPGSLYPAFEAPLSDLAGISIVQLQGAEQGLFVSQMIGANSSIDETRGLIFITCGLGEKTCVGVFDMQGRFLRKIGRVGRGPGEFSSPSIRLLPDPEKETLFIYDTNSRKVLRFGYDGTYHPLNSEQLDPEIPNTVQWSGLPDKFLMFNLSSQFIYETDGETVDSRTPTLALFDKADFAPLPTTDIHFGRPHDLAGYIRYRVYSSGPVRGQGGVWLNPGSRSDTTWFFSDAGRATPRLLNTAHNSAEQIFSVTAEGADYLFCRFQDTSRRDKVFAIRKSDGEIFSIPPDSLIAMAFYFQNTTVDGKHCILPLPEIVFKDELVSLVPEARPLLDAFDENDNPLLVILTLR